MLVSRFSAGAASAVATKLILTDYLPHEVRILRAWLADEDEDNDRFAAECEVWFGHYIITVSDWKYKASAQEVFRQHRFIKNRWGAPCSRALKADVMDPLCALSDTYVLGFTSEESDRLDRFLDANNGRKVICPLIDRGLTKADCLAIVENAGIALPQMYRRGYNNNNCRCCPKGGEGYFNRQRIDFPQHYEQLCQIQDTLGPGSYLFRNRKTGERYSLRNLPSDSGRHKEPDISCSAYCMMAEEEISPGE